MRVSITTLIDGSPGRGLDFIAGVASNLERLGFHGLRVPDHVIVQAQSVSAYPHSDTGRSPLRDRQPFLAPLMVLQAAATSTTTLRLGTAVEIIPLRHPVTRAQEVATLDVLSGGRFDYGVGIGWQREEFDACGIEFPTRGRRADEFLLAAKAVWSGVDVSYHGAFFAFDSITSLPLPAQRPHPPILIGGTSMAALQRAATHGDGWFAWEQSIEEIDEKTALLRQMLEQRDDGGDGFETWVGLPYSIQRVDELVPLVGELERRGIDELVVGVALSQRDHVRQLEEMAQALIDRPKRRASSRDATPIGATT